MIKWIYNLELVLIKRRRDRIEKKYYKVFPDRVNDHAIATAPVPVLRLREKKYHAVTLKAEILLPKNIIDTFGADESVILHELFFKLEPEISKRIEIHTLMDPEEKDLITYEAYFRFYEED